MTEISEFGKNDTRDSNSATGQVLSVEGQVKHLIAEAQDPHNLAQLFPGWAPWL